MKAFAALLDRLSYSPARNAKIRLIAGYLRATPDPDRGWALAALSDRLDLSFPWRRILGELLAGKIDPELYRLSRDYVGDTAETVALLWPGRREEPQTGAAPELRITDIVGALQSATRAAAPVLIAQWLDQLDITGRWALLKLLTGALRVGASARLAKTALATLGNVEPDDIEQIWHGLSPPYIELFAWLEGRGPKPEIGNYPAFRPMMLAHPIEDRELAELDVAAFAAEWKWDGIRVQVVAAGGGLRLYTRTGDDISQTFPDVAGAFAASLVTGIVLDGELLIVRGGTVAAFNDLQQRLNRKAVTKAMLDRYPAHVRLYDLLMQGDEDLRPLAFDQRRARLEAWHARAAPASTSVSELLAIPNREELERIWGQTRGQGIEGLMLKRRASPYLAGRPKGHWYKMKRAALTIDCVLMYAQRGSGKRSSYYSDYTFGAWTTDDKGAPRVVPVGKAYSGFTDEELLALDKWIRTHTVERFGPVLSVAPELVLEVAFDAVQRSPRHKSGVAMRFPRIHRIRWDKPAAEADRLETLVALIDGA